MPQDYDFPGLPPRPKPNIYPVTGNPVLDRAIGRAVKSKQFGPEIQAADIGPMSMLENDAVTDTLGYTKPNNEVRLSPSMLAAAPEISTDETLAHELTHVKQNRGPMSDVWSKYDRTMPYQYRPSEMQAFEEAKKYKFGLPKKYQDEQFEQLGYLPGMQAAIPTFFKQ